VLFDIVYYYLTIQKFFLAFQNFLRLVLIVHLIDKKDAFHNVENLLSLVFFPKT
jgi:hypothetical protein